MYSNPTRTIPTQLYNFKFLIIIHLSKWLNISIWPIDGTLTNIITCDVSAIELELENPSVLMRCLLYYSSLHVVPFWILRIKMLTITLMTETDLFCLLERTLLSHSDGTSFYTLHRVVEFSRIFSTIPQHSRHRKYVVIFCFFILFFFAGKLILI